MVCVSEQLGHNFIELTVKRYGHFTPEDNRCFISNFHGKSAPYSHPDQDISPAERSTKVRKFWKIRKKDGAGKGIRTPDFNLGKVALYH